MSTATIPRPSKPWGLNFKQSIPDLIGAIATLLIVACAGIIGVVDYFGTEKH